MHSGSLLTGGLATTSHTPEGISRSKASELGGLKQPCRSNTTPTCAPLPASSFSPAPLFVCKHAPRRPSYMYKRIAPTTSSRVYIYSCPGPRPPVLRSELHVTCNKTQVPICGSLQSGNRCALTLTLCDVNPRLWGVGELADQAACRPRRRMPPSAPVSCSF